jgi:voltage-gated potassium channel
VSQSKQGQNFDALKGLFFGLLVLVAFVALSSLGFWLLGYYYYRDPTWTPLKCVYHVVITITTIGYGDVLHSEEQNLAAAATMVLAFIGMGVPVFIITMMTSVVVDRVVGESTRKRRMEKKINALAGHYIVCGAGHTGSVVIDELLRTRRPLVVVDRDEARLKALVEELGDFLWIAGDASQDAVLLQAGIERASGLVATLADDRDNVFLTLTARQLGPGLRIVAQGSAHNVEDKLKRAGASAVVSINRIGGMRLVSEAVRPAVTNFLDAMLRDREANYRFEEVVVADGAPGAGKTLGESGVGGQSNVLAVGLRKPGSEVFEFNPKPEVRLSPGQTVVMVGPAAEIAKIRERLG